MAKNRLSVTDEMDARIVKALQRTWEYVAAEFEAMFAEDGLEVQAEDRRSGVMDYLDIHYPQEAHEFFHLNETHKASLLLKAFPDPTPWIE
jgi:hypothetical protein